MTCDKCEEVQAQNAKGRNCAFIGVGKANVLIGACDEHFNELRHAPKDAMVARVL
jgi:hypothetical protein